MNTKEFEVIEVSKELSVVVDREAPLKLGVWALLDNTITEVPDYVGLHVVRIFDETMLDSAMALKCPVIIAPIGQKLEGVPRVVLNESAYSENDLGDYGEFLFENWINNPNEYFKNKSAKWLIKKWKESRKIKSVVLEMETKRVMFDPNRPIPYDKPTDKPKLTTPDEIVPVEVRY